LLVDDHQMMREGLRRLIAREPGLTVVGEASNGSSAREKVRDLAPHLVLMDIHLPGESGVDLTPGIIAEFPSVKVIVLSGDSTADLMLRALRAGASGYVIKKNGVAELIRAIHMVMDHRLYLSAEVSAAVISKFTESSSDGGQTGMDLSGRERMLLRLVATGNHNQEIATALAVTVKSVETYRSRLQKKLGCGSTAELVRYAIREGIAQA